MRHFALPEHMVEWCEEQVALGRSASVGTYLAQLIMEDRGRQARNAELRRAIREARESGVSMRSPELALVQAPPKRLDPRVAAAKLAVEEGRLSGTSLASIEGILARATGVAVAA
ncbi:hypothetical protein L6Q21_10470 [Sandaracinobacter sp. RS1-74]|uniref:ribbon-helix-helix domain-containing protein n=1 Tax=Sandaracinobacteroides sayramensis TaxID=2913411 RepID=UPI001EDB2865|nr:hypothetical protein [Sandaracinobacteroides sayramensis]MCG2841405.1 hypothetical protein [Sandaracinobacteroides sayramensis]